MVMVLSDKLQARSLVALVAVVLVLAAIGCNGGGNAVPGPGGEPQAYLDADGLNGGLLYDKFWSADTGWNQGDPNLATFSDHADFFRCKQCHGWDLLGSQGAYISRAPKATRPNVSALNLRATAAGMTAQQLFDALKSSTGRRSLNADLSAYDPDTNSAVGDQMPDYGSFFSDAQLWDLVKFLKAEAINTDMLYDSVASGNYPTGSMDFSNIGKDGDGENGHEIYEAKCEGCHGEDGAAFLVDGDEYTIGSFVRAKPNEAQHKVKFGNPGSEMGSLVTALQDIKDLYKALTDTEHYPDPEAVVEGPPEFDAANGITGGLMYDKFWAADAGWDQGDPNLSTFSDNADFFRCKQCHGWDLLGTAGAYISRAPKATRPNVSSVNLWDSINSMTPQQLFDALKSPSGRRDLGADLSTYDPDTNSTVGDQMPDYGSFMTDTDLWNLVKFLLTAAVDTSELYNSSTTGAYPSGSINFSNIGLDGEAEHGDPIYAARCASCHGADGTAFLVDGDEYTIGSFVRAKPNEAQHKVKFGNPGSGMGSLVTETHELQDLYKALTDTTKYPDP